VVARMFFRKRQRPNTAAQPLPEAGAQRTLEAIGCSGLLAGGWDASIS